HVAQPGADSVDRTKPSQLGEPRAAPPGGLPTTDGAPRGSAHRAGPWWSRRLDEVRHLMRCLHLRATRTGKDSSVVYGRDGLHAVVDGVMSAVSVSPRC